MVAFLALNVVALFVASCSLAGAFGFSGGASVATHVTYQAGCGCRATKRQKNYVPRRLLYDIFVFHVVV